MTLLAGCRITQSLVLPYYVVGEIYMNNRSCLEEVLLRDAAVPSPPNRGRKTISHLPSSCVLTALGGLRGPSPGVVKHSTEV